MSGTKGDVSKPKINTMKALSQRIEISRPTLSRYFQDPHSVREGTRLKIEERLTQVDYVYNFMATRQNRKSTGLIGVVIPHFNDPFFATFIEEIESSARKYGFTVITQGSEGDARIEEDVVRKLRSMNADGAIIASLGFESVSEAFKSASEDFPIVFADSHPFETVPHTDFVGTDNTQGMSVMIDYLCRTGEKPIYLGMPGGNLNAVEREKAYCAKMDALGLEPCIIDCGAADKVWEFEAYGYEVMNEHFSQQRYTNATILCANDRLAIGAIRVANKHGLFAHSIEGKGGLRIAGHDDHPLSRFMYPSITTAAQDVEGIAEDSVRLLVERIRGERDDAPVRILKESSLKLRESA